MSQQLGQHVIDVSAVNTSYDEVRKPALADLAAGIRIDDAPTHDGQRLADEGEVYPLTIDNSGHLRVVMPANATVETQELEVLREIRDLIIETRDLLLKIV